MNSSLVEKPYSKRLESRFTVLESFYEQLLATKNDKDFFRIVSGNVLPLIQKSPQIKQLYEQWTNENEAFEQKLQNAKAKAFRVLKETFDSIFIQLKKTNYSDNPEIVTRINIIKSFISIEPPFRNFRYFQNFARQLKLLLHQILELDEQFDIKSFAEVEKLEQIPFQKSIGHTKKFIIFKYVFDLEIQELTDLEQMISWKEPVKPWVAFSKLLKAERAWNSKRKDFENNNSVEEFVEWKDMESLKNGIATEKALFFIRERYLDYILTLLNEIMVHHESTSLPLNTIAQKEEKTHPIQEVSLNYEHDELFIRLVGPNNEYVEKINIHNFSEISSPKDMFKSLCQKRVGEVFDCEAGGGTVPKHLGDVKFPSIFRDLFIHRISTHKVKLKANPILVSEISQSESELLFQEIDRLRNKNQKASKKKNKPKRTSK
jgi:hypothetical protein